MDYSLILGHIPNKQKLKVVPTTAQPPIEKWELQFRASSYKVQIDS
jgi:hypothetical protein